MKYILVLGFITLFTFGYGDEICPNCETLLREVLNKCAATDEGPFYNLVKVNAVAELRAPGDTHAVNSVNAELLDTNGIVKTCEVGITGKPMVKNGYLVTFYCVGEDIILRRLE